MKALIASFFAVIASLFSAKKWGEAVADKEIAEKVAEDVKEDAKISSKPFIDNPFSRMRRKK